MGDNVDGKGREERDSSGSSPIVQRASILDAWRSFSRAASPACEDSYDGGKGKD